MGWHQISVVTNEAYAPDIADHFSELGALSVTYMDAEDEPVYEPGIGETKIWAQTKVIALYDLDVDPKIIQSRLIERFQAMPLQAWQIEEIVDQVWERAWMEHYRPMKFGDKLWVCPTGQEPQEDDTVCLILDPGLAFGTGTHPTTALCLEWLAGHQLTGKTVIDYGCGSGILAIAAVLLGAEIVYAVDIDPQAITATENNAIKNYIKDKIVGMSPEQFDKVNVEADVVLANILAKPLIDMAEHISGLVKHNGFLVLSGILAEQADSVFEGYKQFLRLDDKIQKEDWVRLVGQLF
jgi:ribosomal protein L11 methyltransferase